MRGRVMPRQALGIALREARGTQKLRDVAALAGVSYNYISQVENGKKEISSELLIPLCEALDVKPSRVLYNAAVELNKVGS